MIKPDAEESMRAQHVFSALWQRHYLQESVELGSIMAQAQRQAGPVLMISSLHGSSELLAMSKMLHHDKSFTSEI